MTLKYEFSIWGGEGEGVAEIDEESEELETAMEGVDNGEEVGKSWEELGVRPLAKMKAAARMAILDFGAPGIFSNNPRKIGMGSEIIPTTKKRKEETVPKYTKKASIQNTEKNQLKIVEPLFFFMINPFNISLYILSIKNTMNLSEKDIQDDDKRQSFSNTLWAWFKSARLCIVFWGRNV